MPISLSSLAFIGAAMCAGLMGFAIQRGGTCSVAAVEELISKRRFNRLAAMLEASIWVGAGLALAHSQQWLGQTPTGFAVSAWTVLGGALLGLGAFVNRACVFGAVARLGSGEWAYLATPLGFYLGCLSVGTVFAPPAPLRLDAGLPVLQAMGAWALPLGAFVVWRLARALIGIRSLGAAKAAAARVWSPHAATTLIGVTFFLMILLVGSWAYTEALADLAGGRAMNLVAKVLLLLALFLGALWGGWTAGRFRSAGASPGQLLRCLAGGVLMGWGSLLIPGANDGLILIGMPLLWPYAWLAFGSMCVSIGLAFWLQRTLSVPATSP